MKAPTLSVTLLFCLSFFISNCDAASRKANNGGIENKKDKLSYSIGVSMARSIIPVKEEINLDQLLKGINDQFYGKTLLISEHETEIILSEFAGTMKEKTAEKNKLIAQKNLVEGDSFLKENKEKDGVTTTQSGLQYLVLRQGNGSKPAKNDKVKVNYKGTTINGIEFDSSYKRGKPAIFPVTGVIKGWREALLLMNVGSKYKLFVPSELAYGSRGAGPVIRPNAVLIFEVELLGIEK